MFRHPMTKRVAAATRFISIQSLLPAAKTFCVRLYRVAELRVILISTALDSVFYALLPELAPLSIGGFGHPRQTKIIRVLQTGKAAALLATW